MTDPIEGRFGQILMAGWIGTAPDTGREAAFLLLTTPAEGAPVTMPLVAQALGIEPGTVTTRPDPDVHVTISTDGSDGWATLHTPGGEGMTRAVTADWAETAWADGRVVLAVGHQPMPVGEDAEAYTARAGNDISVGIVPLVG